MLPFRLICYTQNDMLSSKPLRMEASECTRQYFPNRSPDPECMLSTMPGIRLRPRLPERPQKILFIRTGPNSLDYRSFIRDTWKAQVEPFAPIVFVCANGATDITPEADQYGERLVGNHAFHRCTRLNQTLDRAELMLPAVKQQLFLDMLQFDFADSYHNLSLKMMAIYGFVMNELPTVDDIIVTNDDTIVNATALAQLFPTGRSGSWMIGKVSRGYPRLFMSWLPWHVPGEMYANLCYPRFTQVSSS
ncbi:unnamed protein product [Heligmosomoides polygyrus]|uniref:Hexosyltransferase n=1 Tax=Heligmosomoides polygyrus TaxID=6339 RepID=A0A3P8IPW8_HELPZ|nr:unnamed protein product [Heligmosomoides polygyrus]